MSVDPTQVPALGAAAALVIVIGYLLTSNRADRSQQETAMGAALKRIKGLEEDLDKLQKQVDTERQLRREAQDEAANALRQVGELRARLDVLTKGHP